MSGLGVFVDVVFPNSSEHDNYIVCFRVIFSVKGEHIAKGYMAFPYFGMSLHSFYS